MESQLNERNHCDRGLFFCALGVVGKSGGEGGRLVKGEKGQDVEATLAHGMRQEKRLHKQVMTEREPSDWRGGATTVRGRVYASVLKGEG